MDTFVPALSIAAAVLAVVPLSRRTRPAVWLRGLLVVCCLLLAAALAGPAWLRAGYTAVAILYSALAVRKEYQAREG